MNWLKKIGLKYLVLVTIALLAASCNQKQVSKSEPKPIADNKIITTSTPATTTPIVIEKQNNQPTTPKPITSKPTPVPTPTPTPTPTQEDYFNVTYTVMCVGAITSFAQCKPIVATEQDFHIIPKTGVVSITHPELPSIQPLILSDCSIIDAQNWSCIDRGSKVGFADGQYFSQVISDQYNNLNRTTTALNIMRNQYLAVQALIAEQMKSQ